MIAFLFSGFGIWMGGFLGGVLSFLAGLPFDLWFWRERRRLFCQERQEAFSFYWHAYALMFKIISAGGGLASSQIEYLEFILNYGNLRRLDRHQTDKVRSRLLSLSHSGVSFHELLREISQGNYSDEQINWLNAHITRLVDLKRHSSPESLLYFQQFQEALNLEEGARRASVCLLDIYGILGCSSFSSNEEIKQKFRVLVKRYHPDALGHELEEREIKEATDRFLNIFEAYTAIRRERNF